MKLLYAHLEEPNAGQIACEVEYNGKKYAGYLPLAYNERQGKKCPGKCWNPNAPEDSCNCLHCEGECDCTEEEI